MRSRINPHISVKPGIIGYRISDGKKKVLSGIAAENNIDINFIGAESAGETVGYLVGVKGMKPVGNLMETPPEHEVLIMAGLKSAVIDRVLKAMRERNAQIDLKCTLTAVNQNWELYRLISELEKEHKAMQMNSK